MPRALLFLGLALLAGLILAWRFGLLAHPAPPGSLAPSRLPALPAGDAPLRLLVVGTSLTAGGDWPDRLGAALAACRAGPVAVERVALPGATSRWGEPALARRLATGPAPHLVLIEYSVNDAVLPRFVPLSESRRRVTRMVEAAQAAGALPFLVTMSELHGRERWERPGIAAYRALYRDVAGETGAGLIDTLGPWRALDREALRAAVPDGAHPTPEAMARLLVPALTSGLKPYACP